MIIVTGTRRSGTSMWMQILLAAGYEVIGEPFPKNWARTLRDANTGGFWESNLRHGVYYRTNPDPHSGQYMRPDQVRRHAVKVFVPGLLRTDLAYIDRVIATIRPWREYEASLRRMYALEDEARRDAGNDRPPPPRMPPALEWWDENYGLITDIALRQYPCHVQSYGGILASPRRVIERALEWLGEGNRDAAVAAVTASSRHFDSPDSSSVSPEIAAVFDELYDTIDQWKELEKPLIERLAATHEELGPKILEHREATAQRPGADPMSGTRDASDGPFATLD